VSKQRIFGVVLVLFALVVVGQSAWFQTQRSTELDCQSDYNTAVAADREALNKMIFTLVDESATDQEKTSAVADYVARARRTDATAPDCG